MSATAEEIKSSGAPFVAIDCNPDNRDEWLKARMAGIGGSDAAVAAGMSPYKTAAQLYYEKRGEMEPDNLDDNERVYWGNKMEAMIGEVYAERTGLKVRRRRQMFQSKNYPFMQANIDFAVVGKKKGLECKNVDKFVAAYGEWGKEGTDEVPSYYFLQCQHYMGVMGYDEWDLAALIGGNELRIYPIERDDSIIIDLIQLEEDLWNRIQKGAPPDWEHGNRSTKNLIKKLYPGTNGEIMELDDDYLHWKEVERQAASMKSEYEKVQELARNHILSAVGEASIAVFPDGTGYTRKQVNKKEVVIPPCSYIDVRYAKDAQAKADKLKAEQEEKAQKAAEKEAAKAAKQ